MRGFSRCRATFAVLGTAFAVSAVAAGTASAANASPETATHRTLAVASAASPAAPASPALLGTPPTASLTVIPAAGTAPLAVVADASASTPGTFPIGYYDFAWGDGSTETVNAPAATTPPHIYAMPGTYAVTVTVVDNELLLPASATTSATVTVTTAVTGPVAAVRVTPASGPAPLTVTASGAGSQPGTFPITSYTFAWGDGTTSGPAAAAAQGHTYPNPGSYTVNLTVADNQAPAHTSSAQFVVNVGSGGAPNPSLVLTPPSGPSPLTVTANATGSTPGSSPIASYAFDFGDGTRAGPQPAASAQHTYPNQGTYTVSVTVTDKAGLTASTSVQFTVGPVSGTVVHRVAGADRIGTAVAVSQSRWDATTDTAQGGRHPQSVVLARSDAFADALAGIPLAAKGKGPLLLSVPAGLDPAVTAEIHRILPAGGTVYLLGGTAALSQGVEDKLKQNGYKTTRLWGADRFATSLQIAKVGLGDPRHIMVATGDDFPDALAAGPFAAAAFTQNGQSAAVILSDGRTLPPAVAAYVKTKAVGSTNAAPNIIGIGGPGAYAVAAAIPASQFDALVGADRFDTAAKVAPYFPANAPLGVANGDQFPDALTGGALQALDGGPMLLVEKGHLPSPTQQALAAVKGQPSTVTVYGGPMAVSAATMTAMANAVAGRVG